MGTDDNALVIHHISAAREGAGRMTAGDGRKAADQDGQAAPDDAAERPAGKITHAARQLQDGAGNE